MSLAFYLALKEVWYNKGRFLLIAVIVGLITTLVLFIAALTEGLGNGNREYLQKLNGELLVYQENVELSIPSSRLDRSTANALRRVPGVAEVGQIFFASATLTFDTEEELDISLVGVEPGLPGEPAVQHGHGLERNRSNEAVIDSNVAERRNITVGDRLRLRVTQGAKEEFYDLTVVGISDGRQYSLLPSIFVPYLTWERIRPQGEITGNTSELISNIAVVKLVDPTDEATIARRLEAAVSKIEVVDRRTAYEATPGYTAQQSTLDTQRYFTFFIGILVIGGFFQIQTLQKVAQIGMLKAVGASNLTIAATALTQIIMINAVGVTMGALGSLGLGATFPPEIPIVFTGDAVATAVGVLMLIGPLGGMVSVWALLKIEPLSALGLAQ